MTATMTATWGNTVHVVTEKVEKSVKLADAPDITWASKANRLHRRSGRPYSVRFYYMRSNGGPWQSEITIYALRPESLVGDFFPPDKVIDPPQWLTDLIDSAHPDAQAVTR